MPTLPKFTPLKQIDETIDELVQLGVEEGYFCSKVREPIPKFRKAQSERVITQFDRPGQPNNNCFIVLGRDRPSNLTSGIVTGKQKYPSSTPS